jgi:hypothetical protein
MTNIYHLKIELTGSDPKIWRKIAVPNDLLFDHLHDVIQIAMGWEGDISFEFIVNKTRIIDFGPELDMGNNPYLRDVMDTSIDEMVTMINCRFTYIYGFNNKWEHQITLEAISNVEEGSELIACQGGERACPPDVCEGISQYQEMLEILKDDKHPRFNSIHRQTGGFEAVAFFNMDEINDQLYLYAEDWKEIYNENQEISDYLENESDGGEQIDLFENIDDYDYTDEDDEENSEYETLRHLNTPQDLINDEDEWQTIVEWVERELSEKRSPEYKTFARLVSKGYGDEESKSMILNALSIEWFYDMKYGTDHLMKRYQLNLDRLPEKPLEIPSLEFATLVLDKCAKGIPFTAIEFLHDDTSSEATLAVINAIKNHSDHKYCWRDCEIAPLWYALAAEGHLCEELIDPVIAIFEENANSSDWLHEQGNYLIGKLAQKFPDVAAQKVLDFMEKDANEEGRRAVYFLYDVFTFCDIDKYKDRLLALLKRETISWHDSLATAVSRLQIKEGLPILQEQLKRLEAKPEGRFSRDMSHIIEIKEAINQLETGEVLYPEIHTPLCLKRTTTWKEEYANEEKYFYDDDDSLDDFDLDALDNSLLDRPGYWPFGKTQQPIIKEKKPGRNDPCPCGSGKKYKKCCMDKDLDEI